MDHFQTVGHLKCTVIKSLGGQKGGSSEPPRTPPPAYRPDAHVSPSTDKHTKVAVVYITLPSRVSGGLQHRVVDKFFSLGVLTFTTHHKQLCAVAMCYIIQIQTPKIWGCFSTPKHPLVYGLATIGSSTMSIP